MKWVVNGTEVELEPTPGIEISQDGERLVLHAGNKTQTALALCQPGGNFLISLEGQILEVERVTPGQKKSGSSGGDGRSLAPMPGLVVDVLVEEGQQVTRGQRLLVLEAIKSHLPVLAAFDAVVTQIPVSAGMQVSEGQVLVEIQPQSPQE